MNRPLPVPARDWALLLSRVLIGVVMFAHGYQKMIINGIGRTTEGFETLSIPLAIVSASFVTVVEFAGSVLLIAGALTPLVSYLMLVIMVGAAVFVHIPNGIFISNGGWELVGVIGAALIAFAAVGPGRYSVDHVVRIRQQQYKRELELASSR
ncbi:DoxX family protein [Pseudonocardia nigra]|uniref:DoxX family protein n=1 Tax=Pseudonocardia nigra TaxID=1921578 RepID=UPI001C5EA1D9|nr:DoxX family protein [Pseudonocardia nigra]